MPWKKRKNGGYGVECQESVYHYKENISLENLNDPSRDFYDATRSIDYMRELIDFEGGELPSGVYKCIQMGYDESYLAPTVLQHDLKLFELDITEKVTKDFKDFVSKEKIYRDLGILYKRGILLYGPPGTGKTTAITSIVDNIRLEDTLVIFCTKLPSTEIMKEFRSEKRLKIFVFEEVTNITSRMDGISQFLTFLDGEDSFDNVYTIATTNYPEELPGNIVDRPGRFDRLYKIAHLSRDDRFKYLKHFLDRPPTEDELDITSKQSIATIKEWLLMAKKDGLTLKEADKIVKQHQRAVKDHFKESTDRIGFIDSSADDY